LDDVVKRIQPDIRRNDKSPPNRRFAAAKNDLDLIRVRLRSGLFCHGDEQFMDVGLGLH